MKALAVVAIVALTALSIWPAESIAGDSSGIQSISFRQIDGTFCLTEADAENIKEEVIRGNKGTSRFEEVERASRCFSKVLFVRVVETIQRTPTKDGSQIITIRRCFGYMVSGTINLQTGLPLPSTLSLLAISVEDGETK